MNITVLNYRAFSDENPGTWKLGDDFTAFVGINNAGKSSPLRLSHELRPTFVVLSGEQALKEAVVGNFAYHPFQSVADQSEVFCNSNPRDMVLRLSLEDPRESEPDEIELRWGRFDRNLEVKVSKEGLTHAEVLGWESWPFSATFRLERGDAQRQVNLDLGRYASFLQDLANSIYLGPFRNAVNVGGAADYYDLRIGESFIQAWAEFKVGNDRGQNKAAIAVQREIKEIFGLESLEINASPGNQTLQIIADDEPYQLQEQGAGLAQFIVVLAYVATRNPSFIFIDEPELNLHPSLQLDFLTTLGRYCARGVAFATHSIGLARTGAQNIYSVRRNGSSPGNPGSARDSQLCRVLGRVEPFRLFGARLRPRITCGGDHGDTGAPKLASAVSARAQSRTAPARR